MSRVSKLTGELTEAIVGLVRSGDSPAVAAGATGVGRQTYYDWMNRGERGEEPYASFRTAITRARDECESRLRASALSGDEPGAGSWGPSKAAFEVLSRRFPARWAPRVKHEITESQRLMLETLRRVCEDKDVIERVCAAKDCGVVFVAVCEKLASLDGEDGAGEAAIGSVEALH